MTAVAVARIGRDWGDLEAKSEARRLTIIDAYREFTGRKTIPKDQQYWTLCGEIGRKGQLTPNCEPDQLVRSGLITWDQFYGVEICPEIHKRNESVVARFGGHVACGEITKVLGSCARRGTFNPAIVNLDTIEEPTKASRYLADTLELLSYLDGPHMVVFNTVVAQKYRGREHDEESIKKALLKRTKFRVAGEYGWEEYAGGTLFRYKRKAITMGTLVYTRRGSARRG